LLAPALAWLLITAWTESESIALRTALIIVCALLVFTMVANWFPFVRKVHALGLHPLAALIFTCCVVYQARFATAKMRSIPPAPCC
jgi:hypothetical protein